MSQPPLQPVPPATSTIPHPVAPIPLSTIPAHQKPTLLMLTHRLPYPPDRGDRIRSYNLLKHLSKHFRVSLASFTDETPTPEQESQLRRLTHRLAITPLSRSQKYFRAARSFLNNQSITTSVFYDPKLAQQLRHWHTEVRFDAVLTFCSGMVQHARDIVGAHPQSNTVGQHKTAHALTTSQRAGLFSSQHEKSQAQSNQPPTKHHQPIHLLDLVDVDSIKWANYARQANLIKRYIFTREAKLLHQIECGIHDHIDALSVVSPAELIRYNDKVRGSLLTKPQPEFHKFAITNGVDLTYFTPTPDPGSDNFNIAFTGVLDYKPNIDAVRWFATQVMPFVNQHIPQATFSVVGKRPHSSVLNLNNQPNINIIGEVPDIRPHIQEAALVVAPLQIAPGVQNKVLEAMAMQRTVICSPAAAQGIDAMVGRDLLTATSPQEYAALIIRHLTNPHARTAISQSARLCVEQNYDWPAVLHPLTHYLLRNLPSKSKKRTHLPKPNPALTQPLSQSTTNSNAQPATPNHLAA